MNYTVLGCGRWGGFIAYYLNKYNHKVTTWGIETDPYVVKFFKTRKNDYLEFPKSIELTNDLNYAVSKNEFIIISISSQHLRELMGKIKNIENYQNKKYIICMKGIESTTGCRLSEVIESVGINKNNIATWVGPGHVQDFLKGIPGAMIIDSFNPKLSKFILDDVKSDLIRFYLGCDMIGTEIGAASKNVMGIAAGILDGLNMQSLKGALMARGTREIARLIKSAGGNEFSAYGLCHLGDYEATLFSKHSHNRMFGEEFVRGNKFLKLAEGVETSSALLKLANILNVELPITKAVNDVVLHGKDIELTMKKLFNRPNKEEFL